MVHGASGTDPTTKKPCSSHVPESALQFPAASGLPAALEADRSHITITSPLRCQEARPVQLSSLLLKKKLPVRTLHADEGGEPRHTEPPRPAAWPGCQGDANLWFKKEPQSVLHPVRGWGWGYCMFGGQGAFQCWIVLGDRSWHGHLETQRLSCRAFMASWINSHRMETLNNLIVLNG